MRRFNFTRILYTAIFYSIFPLVLLHLIWRGRRSPAYLARWRERFGFFTPSIAPGGIWVHAVSVGETMTVLPLVRMLKSRYPAMPIIFTTTTPTGSDRVKQALGDLVFHVYVPYDLPGMVKRFLNRTKPSLILVMETEIWPNIFYECNRRDIPIILANARLSPRSFSRYGRFPKITQATMEKITVIAAQSNDDAQRFIALGAYRKRVRVTGNMKFDINIPEELLQKSLDLRVSLGDSRPVWIAASTHAGEDEIVLKVFKQLRPEFPHLLLIVVPRHPERFDEVTALCKTSGFTVQRRSTPESTGAPDIYIGDTMGELLLLYGAADVAFVGGSLIPHGGQNLLEPAALGLPVVFGQYITNFQDIGRMLLEVQAAIRVDQADDLYGVVASLLKDPELRNNMGQRAKQLVQANRGAIKDLMLLMQPVLPR